MSSRKYHKIVRIAVAALAVGAGLASAAETLSPAANKVRAAWFEQVISNPIGSGIAGYGGGDVAKAKLDDLLLCGLCVDDGRRKALLLSFDLVCLDIDTIVRYRRHAAKALGISLKSLSIVSS